METTSCETVENIMVSLIHPPLLKSKAQTCTDDVDSLFSVSVYVLGNQGDKVTIQCLPNDTESLTNVQMYEWKEYDNKVVVVSKKVKWSQQTGELTISDITFSDSKVYICTVIMPGDETMSFEHNLIGMNSV